ncbi:hypothetical protein RchiOBHm_Chr0c25g0500881 [Rosa chinensis]|uniref:Uncharacterized protein n=1 Tax=Rosa chinensis TaxID=74649 RepID=A0A2P6SQG0_ROSCH|nr:hypothetical protein RchiOBHm_Chr0c25g0500881 [Rosa chinensis]
MDGWCHGLVGDGSLRSELGSLGMVFGQEVIGNELSWLGSDLGWEVMQIMFWMLPIYRGALVGFSS